MDQTERAMLALLQETRRLVGRLETKEYLTANDLSSSYVRYSGTPVAGQVAQWSGAGTLTQTGYLGSVVARYSGVPSAGNYAYWTANGTVADSGFGTSQLPRYSGTPTAGNFAYWTAAGTIADSGFGTSVVPRYTGTPVAGELTYWVGPGTVGRAPFGTADVVRYSGAPSAGQLAYWTAAGSVAGTSAFGTADLMLLSGNQTASGNKSFTGQGSFSNATFPPLKAERTSSQTSAIRTGQSLGHRTTANMADGFGTSFAFEINDDTLTTQNVIADIAAARDGGDDSGKIIMRPYTTGNTPVDVVYVTKEGRMGINQSAPLATLDLLQSTLGSAVYQYASTATNDDPTEAGYQNRVATTNNTQTTLHTTTIPSGKAAMIEAVVLARRTGGSSGAANDSAGYVVRAMVKDVSGTATLVGAVSAPFTAEDQAGWDATIDVTGATARVRVTGATNNNITWHLGMLRMWQVGS